MSEAFNSPQPQPGGLFAGYRLERVLGQGAMGRVYLAQDPSLGRQVAIKLLGRETPASVERFQREGELAARLEHPGIVRVHAAGCEAGANFIVYELVPGVRPLDEAWEGVALRQRVTWIRDVAGALGYAHEQGVVHRDIKPENLLVDAEGTVRVTDFGVAAAIDLERMTQSGMLVGTPTHMSPEQITGKARPGPASDVWALGVVLYQALCDDLPFTGHDWLTLAAQVTGGRFRPPIESGDDVPADLDLVCQAALSPDPDQRPPDGAAFSLLLDNWLAGRALGLGQRSSTRRPLLGAALALALVSLVGLAAWARVPSSAPATPERSLSAVPSPTLVPTLADLRDLTRDLRRVAPGLKRVAALRAAEARLAKSEGKERTKLLRSLATATERPLAELTFDFPAGRKDLSVSPKAWGDRIFMRASRFARLLNPSTQSFGPWSRIGGGLFGPISPALGVFGSRWTLAREGEEVRADTTGTPLPIPKQKLTAFTFDAEREVYVACSGRSLSWGSLQTRKGSLPLMLPAVKLSLSPDRTRIAVSCVERRAIGSNEKSDIAYHVRLEIYEFESPGEQPRLLKANRFSSRIQALAWLDEDTICIGQLVGNVLRWNVSTEEISVCVGPGGTKTSPAGGIKSLTVREDAILAATRDRLLAWGRKDSREVLRQPWPSVRRKNTRSHSSVEHEGLLWVFSRGDAWVYSANAGQYAAEARAR